MSGNKRALRIWCFTPLQIKRAKKGSKKSVTGFTLAEVMVALSIVAIALTVLIHSVVLGIKLADRTKTEAIKIFLMEEKMAELDMQYGGGTGVGDSGDFEEPFKGFTWEKETESTSPIEDINTLTMDKITLTVFSPGESTEGGLRVVTYLSKKEEQDSHR